MAGFELAEILLFSWGREIRDVRALVGPDGVGQAVKPAVQAKSRADQHGDLTLVLDCLTLSAYSPVDTTYPKFDISEYRREHINR